MIEEEDDHEDKEDDSDTSSRRKSAVAAAGGEEGEGAATPTRTVARSEAVLSGESTSTPINKVKKTKTHTVKAAKIVGIQRKPRAASALLLPTQNPLLHAGLNTQLAVLIVLIPLLGQFVGRSFLPWYIGTDETTARDRTVDVLGNLSFLLGVSISVLIFVFFRSNRQ